jgi:mono/diheme cytochrome c family protein
MYHSVAYEPFKQIDEWDAGRWVTSIDYPATADHDKGHAEYYNSNLLNPHHMNMREPAPNTVSRNPQGWLPYSLPNDSSGLRLSDRLKNPMDTTATIVAQGKILYETYCDHCHGPKGEGNGKVADKYAGVPNYKSDALKNITEGHIFHVITFGKGLMKQHGSQVTPEERWKIARYVKTLQK